MTISFTDGIVLGQSGPRRVERHSEGVFVVGGGMAVPLGCWPGWSTRGEIEAGSKDDPEHSDIENEDEEDRG